MSRVLFVLGMHRSGTSLVARSLKCLGAELGEAAVWSGPDNPTGFWEHQGVLAVNEQVLRLCGASWDAPPGDRHLEESCQRLPELVYLRGGAEHMLRRELDRHPVFAVKDPRLCVLMPFWKPVLAGLGCEVSVIRVVRHPGSVAASLHRRDKMGRDRALRLWLRYTVAAREETAGWRSVVTDYDLMMMQPATEFVRLARRLDLPFDRREGQAFVKNFRRADLWNLAEETDLPTEVDIAWQQVRREATEP